MPVSLCSASQFSWLFLIIAVMSSTQCVFGPHLLDDIPALASDSTYNAIIEIPSGTNQKWEVNKETGKVEWIKINPDSGRVVEYLAYPANYGFIPQTLLPKEAGGDGDPVDIFVLGPAIERGQKVKVKLIGIIHMLDNNEEDSKLLAVTAQNPVLQTQTLQKLKDNYPGIVEILQTWLSHYKGGKVVELKSVGDEKEAADYVKAAIESYQIAHRR